MIPSEYPSEFEDYYKEHESKRKYHCYLVWAHNKAVNTKGALAAAQKLAKARVSKD